VSSSTATIHITAVVSRIFPDAALHKAKVSLLLNKIPVTFNIFQHEVVGKIELQICYLQCKVQAVLLNVNKWRGTE